MDAYRASDERSIRESPAPFPKAGKWSLWLAPQTFFLILAPLLYAAFALITPPFQTPDEHQHMFRAWQLSEFHLIGERGNGAGGVLPESLGRAALPELGTLQPFAASRPIVKRDFGSQFTHGTPVDAGGTRRFLNFSGSVVYAPAGYLPQVGSIWLGQAAGLSVESILYLGRLLNGALAVVLIYLAIRLTPVGKLAFAFVALLPMSAAASASFGQDGLVIAGSCLITAVGLRLLFNETHRRRDLLVTALLTLMLTLAKVVYLPLTLIGCQPFSGQKSRGRQILVLLLICALSAGLELLWMHAVSHLSTKSADVPPVAERLQLWSHDPAAVMRLFSATYIDHGFVLFGSAFAFGWLNIGPVGGAAMLSFIAMVVVLITGDPAARLGWPTRSWLLLLAASSAVLLSLVMYFLCTSASFHGIDGLQGRYFIPLLPAVLVAATPRRQAAPICNAVVLFLMIGANLAALTSIARAFYAF